MAAAALSAWGGEVGALEEGRRGCLLSVETLLVSGSAWAGGLPSAASQGFWAKGGLPWVGLSSRIDLSFSSNLQWETQGGLCWHPGQDGQLEISSKATVAFTFPMLPRIKEELN